MSNQVMIPLHPSVGQIYSSFWDIKTFLLTYHWIIAKSTEGRETNDHYFICYDKDKQVAIVINIIRDNRKFIITNVRTVSYEKFLKKVQIEQMRQKAKEGGDDGVR